jgi:ribosomal protein L31
MIGPFAQFLEEECIIAQYTMPNTQQQNCVAERRNHTTKKKGFLDGFKPSRNRKKTVWKKVHTVFSGRFKTVQDNGSVKVFADGFTKTIRKKLRTVRVKPSVYIYGRFG